MSVEIVDSADGILTIKISGEFTQPALAAAQKRAAEILRRQGKMPMLVLNEGVENWSKEGDWADVSFQIENDQFIERMAIVGEKKWEDIALIFVGKSFREFPIEYFPPEELAKAKAWLKGHS
jgi:hypothetical protein